MLYNTIFIAWASILPSSAASRSAQGPPILSSSGAVKNAWNLISASPYIYVDGVLKQYYEIGKTIGCKN
jgi:hypothetical protein